MLHEDVPCGHDGARILVRLTTCLDLTVQYKNTCAASNSGFISPRLLFLLLAVNSHGRAGLWFNVSLGVEIASLHIRLCSRSISTWRDTVAVT